MKITEPGTPGWNRNMLRTDIMLCQLGLCGNSRRGPRTKRNVKKNQGCKRHYSILRSSSSSRGDFRNISKSENVSSGGGILIKGISGRDLP
jgi:hypothetical protein